MSSYNYTPMAQRASNSIAKFGKPATIKRLVGEVRDPVTGEVSTPGTLISGTFIVVNLPATSSKSKTDFFDNMLIEESSLIGKKIRFILLGAFGAPFIPQSLDVCTLDGEDYEVAGCTPIKPGDTELIYKVGIRR